MESNARQTLHDLKLLDNRSETAILAHIITQNDVTLNYQHQINYDNCNDIIRIQLRHFMLTGYYGLLPYRLSKQHQLWIDILSQHLLALDLQCYRQNDIISEFDQSIRLKTSNPLIAFQNTLKNTIVKSAAGMGNYLSQYYRLPIAIKQNIPCWQTIENPHPDRLGITSYLGKTQHCIDQQFELTIGPVSYKQYNRIIFNKVLLKHIGKHLCAIVGNHQKFSIKVLLKPNRIPSHRLVKLKKKKLGMNIFLPASTLRTLLEYTMYTN